MIIDAILDRKDYEADGWDSYWTDCQKSKTHMDLKYMYEMAMMNRMAYLAQALDGGEEADVKAALCQYIDEENYNPDIKEYVNSVQWLVDLDKIDGNLHYIAVREKNGKRFQPLDCFKGKTTKKDWATTFTKGEAEHQMRLLQPINPDMQFKICKL